MHLIQDPQFSLCTITKLVESVFHRICCFIADPWHEKSVRITGPDRLYRDGKLCLIHMVDKIAQHSFRSAAVKGFNKKEDFQHILPPPIL